MLIAVLAYLVIGLIFIVFTFNMRKVRYESKSEYNIYRFGRNEENLSGVWVIAFMTLGLAWPILVIIWVNEFKKEETNLNPLYYLNKPFEWAAKEAFAPKDNVRKS